MEALDNPEDVSQPIDESIPLTKPKKSKRVVTEKQLESMKAGREILKQNRELAKAKKILEAKEILDKYTQPKPEPILNIKPAITYEISENKVEKSKKKLPPLKIPEQESSEEGPSTPEIVILKKKKKPKAQKAPKITYKYITDSDDSSSDDDQPPTPPPQKSKGLKKPERAKINQKQIRPQTVNVFCD